MGEKLTHDPLAWLHEESEAPPVVSEPTPTVSTPAIAVQQPAPATAKVEPLTLDEDLTVAQARELQERLQRQLDGRTTITINASRVARVDGAALQLLVAFVRALRQQGGELRWEQPSAPLRDAARLSGLDGPLALR